MIPLKFSFASAPRYPAGIETLPFLSILFMYFERKIFISIYVSQTYTHNHLTIRLTQILVNVGLIWDFMVLNGKYWYFLC